MFDEILEAILATGYAASFRAAGDSMHPTIRWGDQVQVIEADDLHVGDVVLVRAARGLTAHRVVSISRSRVVTRGDNALVNDEPVDAADVLGRISSLTRHGMTFLVPASGYGVLRRLKTLGRRLLGPLQISRKTNARNTNDLRLAR